ncbi:hypothetical protein F4781DRAFT_440556 [Annulohypoxylon bovei var. microspora]|nr:hypothetical protein F4781DRAFT_440556 [Annulohypoxylon bovei var. microspora]
MGQKSNLFRYARAVGHYYDDGERDNQGTIYIEPLQIFAATNNLAAARESKVLFVELPFNTSRLLTLSHELLHSVRDTRRIACTWFFGSNRPFPFHQQHVSPQAKILSLMSSMIMQLISHVPGRFDDTEGALSEEAFNSLQLVGQNYMGMSLSVFGAMNIIKALVDVIPHEILFFFQGCDDLLPAYDRPLDEITLHFADLLHHLARHRQGRPRKILYIGCGGPVSFGTVMSAAMRPEDYSTVVYPPDWNDGRRRQAAP